MQVVDNPIVAEIVNSIDWKVTSEHSFAVSQHVNLQEINEAVLEVRRMSSRMLVPERQINFSDSLLTIGAWHKGRSSAYLINGLLRKKLGFEILFGKNLVHHHVGTKSNPADDPSRHVPLRRPVSAAPWLTNLLVAEDGHSRDLKLPPHWK